MSDLTDRDSRLHEALQRYFTTESGENDLEDYVTDMPATAILPCLPILMPPLFEVAGMVFQNLIWQGGPPEGPAAVVKRNLEDTGGDRQLAQKILNEIELEQLFRSPDPMERDEVPAPVWAPNTVHMDRDTETFLAECIADSWRGWLLLQYPARSFTVEVLPETQDNGIAVTFFEHNQAE